MSIVKTKFIAPYKQLETGKFQTNLKILDSTKPQSGVYLIKQVSTGKIVYVGYSESKLYRTIFRHFQKWIDIQKAVKTRFTYPKTGYLVRIILTTPARAAMLEKHIIMQLQPRDNSIKYDNYLTASQQATCEKMLIQAEEYPF